MYQRRAMLDGRQRTSGQGSSILIVQHGHTRLHYLDWLRVLAVLGVFYAHALSIFDLIYWHVNNQRGQSLVTLGTEWGMALFFLLAGASVWFSLGSRTGRQFARERFARLFIPFFFGVLLLSPPQGYLLDTSRSLYSGSFFAYYPYFFTHIRLSATPEVLGAYGFNLWFLAVLFLFSLLALPLFLYLRCATGQRVSAWLAALCERPGGVLVFVLPLALIQLTLRASFPGYEGWADFFSWFVYFVSGYLLFSDARFVKAIERQGLMVLAIALMSLGVIVATMYGPDAINLWESTPGYTLKFELLQLLITLLNWSAMVFIVYFAMRCLNGGNRVIRYADEAILPFYVLHHFMIVLFVSLLFPWHISLTLKFVIVSTLALPGTLGIYELLIRRIRPMRWLFGMKPRGQV